VGGGGVGDVGGHGAMEAISDAAEEDIKLMPDYIATFHKWMQRQGRKDSTARAYARQIALLFDDDGKSPASMATQEYCNITKTSFKNKVCNNQRSASLKLWIDFWQECDIKTLESSKGQNMYQVRRSTATPPCRALPSLRIAGARKNESAGCSQLPFRTNSCQFLPLSWIRGCPYETALISLGWLTWVDLCRFRSVATFTSLAGDGEVVARCHHFTYYCDVGVVRVSSRGRKLTVRGAGSAPCLIHLLLQRRLAFAFHYIDVTEAPPPALESKLLRAALGAMPYLKHIILPQCGWQTMASLRKLLKALPDATTYELKRKSSGRY